MGSPYKIKKRKIRFFKAGSAKKKGVEQGAPEQMEDGELSFVEFICEEQRCSTPFFKANY